MLYGNFVIDTARCEVRVPLNDARVTITANHSNPNNRRDYPESGVTMMAEKSVKVVINWLEGIQLCIAAMSAG